MKGLLEMIKSNANILIVLALIIVVIYVYKPSFIMEHLYKFSEKLENVDDKKDDKKVVQGEIEDVKSDPAPVEAPVEAKKFPEAADLSMQEGIFVKDQEDSGVVGDDKIKADDLLPKYDEANAFAKENPVSKLLKEQNFLISGYHVGINTVMQSNKIPYLDIRSLPPIPKENVGPWNQSSFEQNPASLRKGFELV